MIAISTTNYQSYLLEWLQWLRILKIYNLIYIYTQYDHIISHIYIYILLLILRIEPTFMPSILKSNSSFAICLHPRPSQRPHISPFLSRGSWKLRRASTKAAVSLSVRFLKKPSLGDGFSSKSRKVFNKSTGLAKWMDMEVTCLSC